MKIKNYERYNYIEAYTNSLIYYLDSDVENIKDILEESYTKILDVKEMLM